MSVLVPHTLAQDDEQARRAKLLLLGKELSWRTGSTIGSLLGWTNRGSGGGAGRTSSALAQ